MKSKGLLLAIALVLMGCDAVDAVKATKKMPDKMDETARKMDETECALKKGIALEALLKEEFGRVLTPAPFDLMPYAKTFAQCATEKELPELTYLWMKKINEVTLNVSNPTDAQKKEFDHRQFHVYSALMAVSAFIPRAKLAGIIQAQVYNDGPYQDAVLEMLMLRYQFIHGVRLEAGLFTKGLVNAGRVELAVELGDEIEYIARLPFAKSIGINVTGFIDPEMDVNQKFDPAIALTVWNDIKSRATRLQTEMKPEPGNEKLFPASKAKVNGSLNVINQRINGWTGRP
jgi:hypothetical protein